MNINNKIGLFFLLIVGNILHAQSSSIKVSGILNDEETGESLPFAKVIVKGTQNGTMSNVDGYFTLFDVPSDTATLIVTYIGYDDMFFRLSPDKDLSNVLIELDPKSQSLDVVEVIAEREELLQMNDGISVVKMSPKEISKLPSIGEKDLFRSFQLLPGVSGSNESSSGLFVRGGTPDQNLVLYDGFTVYHIDHMFGMFSAFNPNAVKSIQLYKGGFDSQFGGRTSSVVDIVGKDGNQKKFNIGADIGSISANAFMEIPIKDKMTILVAGRRSWQSFLYNRIFDGFSSTDEAEEISPAGGGGKGSRSVAATTPSSYFYDLNAKITYKPTNKDNISFSFFNGLDNLDNSIEFSRERNGQVISGAVNDITNWGSWGMSTTWSRKWSDMYYSNALVSVSNYFSTRDLSNSRVFTNAFGEQEEISTGSIEDNRLQDYTFKFNNELKLNKFNQLEFGLQNTFFNIDYNYLVNDTISIQERDDIGSVHSLFLQDRIKLFRKLTLVPGVRVSYYDVTDKLYYEPRASVNFSLTEKWSLKGAWGHYYQFANRIIRNDISSGSKDFWVLSDGDAVPVGFAEHFIAGTSYETKGFVFSAEGYYKNLKGLSEYSLQFAPSFNNVDFNEFFYEGTGVSKGAEFLIQKKYGKYNGWVGYTYGQTIYNFPIYGENSFYANHDVTHEFKIVNMLKLKKKWTLSATWIYATGRPYTEPAGGYTLTLADGSIQDFIQIGTRNNQRYPAYHRLDVAATKDFTMGETGNGSLSISIFNLYNRQNIWYKQFEVDAGELIETNVNLLGFMPSVTLSFKLR
ncbi:MAG: ferric enterobactin receptor [Crocinitomix sp.]|jgi:ferric enterobactin receptor